MAHPSVVEEGLAMDSRARYEELLAQLYHARSAGVLDEKEEYAFACALEELWDQLDEGDQAKVEAATEAHKRSFNAPKQLGLDVVVTRKSHERPRAA